MTEGVKINEGRKDGYRRRGGNVTRVSEGNLSIRGGCIHIRKESFYIQRNKKISKEKEEILRQQLGYQRIHKQ